MYRALSPLSLLLAVLCACAATEPASKPARASQIVPALQVEPWPTAKLFHPTGPWLGADGAYSVDLGAAGVLWLFGDTFLDPQADGSRENGPNFFVRNSVALQTGPTPALAHDPERAELRYFWGPDANGAPSSFFHDVDGAKEWLWPLHGVRLPGGELLLFRMHVAAASGGLGFTVSGGDAVAIDDPSALPPAWRPRLVMPLRAAAADSGMAPDDDGGAPASLLLGASVLVYGAHLYVYAAGNAPGTHPIYLARFALAALAGLPAGVLADPEWFCGSMGYVRQSAGAVPLALFPDGQIELSVSYSEKLQRFVEIQTRGGLLADAGTAVAARFAAAPEGPWSKLVGLYRPVEASRPDAANLITYAAKAHPEQRGADLVLTYVVNDLHQPTPPDALYYPRTLRVSWGAK